MSRRALIIGASGQLGGALAAAFTAKGWEILTPPHAQLDLEGNDAVKKIVDFKPSLVLNTAWLPVADCQKDPERAYRINALGEYWAALGAHCSGAPIIYLSTDYVFDGEKRTGFAEGDCPHPLNIYGASKLAGEQLTAIANSKYYVVRTSALFGDHAQPNKNFILKMKSRAEASEPTKVVNDQSTCFTYAPDLAPVIVDLFEKTAPYGTYHITNSGVATWYDAARVVFERLGRADLLEPTETTADPSGMVRPRYSVLRSQKLTEIGILPLPDWKDALSRYLGHIT